MEAGTAASIPVMVDFGNFRPERPYQDLVEKLRPGDISTHMYLGAVPMLDDDGRMLPYLFEARKRGVIFDVGHAQAASRSARAVPAMRHRSAPIPSRWDPQHEQHERRMKKHASF